MFNNICLCGLLILSIVSQCHRAVAAPQSEVPTVAHCNEVTILGVSLLVILW